MRLLIMAAGAVSAVILTMTAGAAVEEARAKKVCENAGHIYSPIRPDSDVNVCWIQPKEGGYRAI